MLLQTGRLILSIINQLLNIIIYLVLIAFINPDLVTCLILDFSGFMICLRAEQIDINIRSGRWLQDIDNITDINRHIIVASSADIKVGRIFKMFYGKVSLSMSRLNIGVCNNTKFCCFTQNRFRFQRSFTNIFTQDHIICNRCNLIG